MGLPLQQHATHRGDAGASRQRWSKYPMVPLAMTGASGLVAHHTLARAPSAVLKSIEKRRFCGAEGEGEGEGKWGSLPSRRGQRWQERG